MKTTEIIISLFGVILAAASLFCACFISIHCKIAEIREQLIQLKNHIENLRGRLDSSTMLDNKTTDTVNSKIPIKEFSAKSKNCAHKRPVRKRKKGNS
jgi:hypothetical protein